MRHPIGILVSLAVILPLAVASPAFAQPEEHHHGRGDEVEGLGAVHFPVSCAPGVQPAFDRAVALLHSFGYEEARIAFHDITREDPNCAMAKWGEAMTWWHPVWAPPSADELAAGTAAATAAAAMPAKSDRETAYVAAIGTFYRDSSTVDHRTRVAAYREAMRQLMARFPDDAEAAIFWALPGVATSSDGSLTQQKEAAAVLEKLRETHPRHPGIIHYLIHAFDYPQTATLALDAARSYAAIAPQSAHARHMPSHIFTRLGLWQESIDSNWSSVEAARAQVERTHRGATSFDALHAYDYIEYAYLQLGQDRKAAEVVAEVAHTRRLDEDTFSAGYALAAIPARFALEQHQWEAAAKLAPPAMQLDWSKYPYALAITPFANAVGAARSGDVATARTALAKIAEVHDGLVAKPPAGTYDWVGQVESLRLAAAGWIAHAEKRDDVALGLLTQASDLEDKVGKHPVTPGSILPAREQLGDLLLELGRPADALAAYEADLTTAPNRFNGIDGARRAAEAAGATARADELLTMLRALCGTDCTRGTTPPRVDASRP
jgi:tetratricopeptide (TPR) repeat protein